MYIDPILIVDLASDDEWLVETEKPCLMDDIVWLDEARKKMMQVKLMRTEFFLDFTTLSNEGSSIAVDNEFREKRQRVASSSVDKAKDLPLMMWMRPGMISIRRMLVISWRRMI